MKNSKQQYIVTEAVTLDADTRSPMTLVVGDVHELVVITDDRCMVQIGSRQLWWRYDAEGNMMTQDEAGNDFPFELVK